MIIRIRVRVRGETIGLVKKNQFIRVIVCITILCSLLCACSVTSHSSVTYNKDFLKTEACKNMVSAIQTDTGKIIFADENVYIAELKKNRNTKVRIQQSYIKQSIEEGNEIYVLFMGGIRESDPATFQHLIDVIVI